MKGSAWLDFYELILAVNYRNMRRGAEYESSIWYLSNFSVNQSRAQIYANDFGTVQSSC